MHKQTILLLLSCTLALSCARHHISGKRDDRISKRVSIKQSQKYMLDTNCIAIFRVDSFHDISYANSKPYQLTTEDLKTTELLINNCINDYNIHHGTKGYFQPIGSGYYPINLNNYRLQLIPFIDPNGDKKVEVDGMCLAENKFISSSWGKDYLVVDGGGACFFYTTVDLTTKTFEHLWLNAPK